MPCHYCEVWHIWGARVTAAQPAWPGEILRLWGDRVDEIRPEIAAKIRAAIADLEGPDGVYAPASTWIITARVPAQ